jgi:hypothetical protein
MARAEVMTGIDQVGDRESVDDEVLVRVGHGKIWPFDLDANVRLRGID